MCIGQPSRERETQWPTGKPVRLQIRANPLLTHCCPLVARKTIQKPCSTMWVRDCCQIKMSSWGHSVVFLDKTLYSVMYCVSHHLRLQKGYLAPPCKLSDALYKYFSFHNGTECWRFLSMSFTGFSCIKSLMPSETFLFTRHDCHLFWVAS